jgi:hypothetical protein
MTPSVSPFSPDDRDDGAPWDDDETRTTLPAPFIDDARMLAEQADAAPAVPMLVSGLMMAVCTWLLHGDWRSLKTWVLLELLIAGATATPAFGLLDVPEKFSSLLLTNEDGALRLGARFAALSRGRGLELEPGAIGISAHRGVWFDDPPWRDRVKDAIVDRGYRVLALDPLRSLTGAVDQGPREFQPFGLACRDLIAETGITLAWAHHDTKPAVGQTDSRRRGHRASGGGIVSAADCPVHIERIGEEPRIIITPAAWKHASDPPPIEVELQTEERDGKLWIARMVGRLASATSGAELVLAGRIRSLLGESPGLSGNAIAKHVKTNRQAVSEALLRMQQQGEVDSYSSGKRGGTTSWMLAKAAVQ